MHNFVFNNNISQVSPAFRCTVADDLLPSLPQTGYDASWDKQEIRGRPWDALARERSIGMNCEVKAGVNMNTSEI